MQSWVLFRGANSPQLCNCSSSVLFSDSTRSCNMYHSLLSLCPSLFYLLYHYFIFFLTLLLLSHHSQFFLYLSLVIFYFFSNLLIEENCKISYIYIYIFLCVANIFKFFYQILYNLCFFTEYPRKNFQSDQCQIPIQTDPTHLTWTGLLGLTSFDNGDG